MEREKIMDFTKNPWNDHHHPAPGERRRRAGGPDFIGREFGGRGRGRGHRGHDHGPHGGGHGGPFGGPFSGRVRRGDLRGLLLAGLLDGPAHGYELMQRLEERTGGRWRPSAGSVYPVLQQLEDEGLATQAEADGRKVYELTEAGREQADPAVFEQFTADGAGSDIRQLMVELKQLAGAVKQIAITADPEVITPATEAVRTARKALYKILAEQ
jgi:DNA-binding PadR family transcriptional regulator